MQRRQQSIWEVTHEAWSEAELVGKECRLSSQTGGYNVSVAQQAAIRDL
jgi:hypothetical protein